MDKSTRNKSFHSKSRREIEKDTCENRLFQGDNKTQNFNPGNFVDFNFPTFFPNMNVLFDFDAVVDEKGKKPDHLGQKIGDFPIEMVESRTINDLQLGEGLNNKNLCQY